MGTVVAHNSKSELFIYPTRLLLSKDYTGSSVIFFNGSERAEYARRVF